MTEIQSTGPRSRGLLFDLASAALTFAAVAVVGFLIFVLLFKLGVAGGIDILFYRGLVLCIVAFAITMAVAATIGHRTRLASGRDAFAAACLSLGLNLSILVVAPVTFDRSISIFILGYMAAHDEQPFTAQQIEGAFRDVYVGQMRQIQRRLEEQNQSGTIVRTDTGYALSPQGASVLRWARRIGWLFDIDPRLIDQKYGPRSAALTGTAKPLH